MMTKRERLGKEQIIKKLGESGYPTYADLFSLFDLHLTKDPDVVGFMVPEKAEITINENLDIEQVSLVVRHEILHEFLDHKKRIEKIGGKIDQISNMAGDYEISNVGYTDADKSAARSIRIGDRVLQGLVTDYDYPEWVDKTYEEIYELLKKESPESLKQPQIGNRGNKNIQDAENAERRAQSIRDSASDAEQQAKQEAGDSGQGQPDNSEDSESGKSQSSGGNSQRTRDSSEQKPENKDGESGDSSEDGDSGSSDGSFSSSNKRNKYDDEEYKNMSPEEKKKERARRRREAAKKLKEEADKLIDDIKDVLDESSSSSGGSDSTDEVFDTPEEQRDKSERIKKIKEMLSDLSKGEQVLGESASAIQKDKAAKAAKDAQKYRSSPLTKFTESLNKFIRDAVARARNNSWAHINKKYVNSGLLKPGQSYSARGNVPLINVYFDRSGSWDKEKTLKGQEAIATLNRYVIRGEIKLNLYYFNTQVGSVDMGGSGGTNGEPILQHILQTKPNNVIILTDDDISDCRSKVIVPGAVWFLWYGTDHNQIADYLSGKQLTKEFRIE